MAMAYNWFFLVLGDKTEIEAEVKFVFTPLVSDSEWQKTWA